MQLDGQVTNQAEPSVEDINAAFSAGFDDTPRTTEAAEPVVTQESVAAPVQPVIEPMRIMPDQWKALEDRVAGFDGIVSKKFDTAMGKYGDLNRLIQQMQNANQSRTGTNQLTASNLKTLSDAGYGDLAEMLAKDLSSMPFGNGIDPAEVQKRINEEFAPKFQQQDEKYTQLEQRHERKLLRVYHRDWEDVVRSEAFNAYKQSLSPEKRDELDNSWDSEIIASHIDAFKEANQQPRDQTGKFAPKPAQVKKPDVAKRLEAAITPTGTAPKGAPALSEAEAFRMGFNDD